MKNIFPWLKKSEGQDCTVSIFTMILPRLETFFLEEWIQYHLAIGVDSIYIYDNGPVSEDHRAYGNNASNKGKQWSRKPDAPHFLEYSDEEIQKELQRIVDMYPQVHLEEWHHPFHAEGDPHNAIPTKVEAYKHCIEKNQSGWWMHIDPDEFLFPKKHRYIKKFLKEYAKFSTFFIHQRVFEQREPHKKVIENIHWKYDIDIVKSLISSRRIKKLAVHESVSAGKRIVVPQKVMSLYHFHSPASKTVNNKHNPLVDKKAKNVDTSLFNFAHDLGVLPKEDSMQL